MIKNKELMEMAKATQAGSAVTLSIEEADKFLDYLVDQSVLKNNCRIIRMAKPEKYIDAIGYGEGRFLVPAGQFTAGSIKSQFVSNQILLATKKARGCVAVSDDDKEDIPTGEDWTDVLMQLIAKKVANELEEVAWISDTANLGGFGVGDLRSSFDGWRYQLDNSQAGQTYANTVTGGAVILDASNTSPEAGDFDNAGKISEQSASDECCLWEHKYHKMLKSVPSEYVGIGWKDYRFWNHPSVTLDYLEALGGRQTALGDQAIMGVAQPKYGTVPIIDAPKMSVTLDANGVHAGGAYTDCLLTPAKNLIMGIQRALTLEKYRDAANERDLWYFSIRMCFAIENVNAAVLLHRLVIV